MIIESLLSHHSTDIELKDVQTLTRFLVENNHFKYFSLLRARFSDQNLMLNFADHLKVSCSCLNTQVINEIKFFLNSMTPEEFSTLFNGNINTIFGAVMLILLPNHLKSHFVNEITTLYFIRDLFVRRFICLCALDLSPFDELNINVLNELKYVHDCMKTSDFNDQNLLDIYHLYYNIRFGGNHNLLSVQSLEKSPAFLGIVSQNHQPTQDTLNRFDAGPDFLRHSLASVAMQSDNAELFKIIIPHNIIIRQHHGAINRYSNRQEMFFKYIFHYKDTKYTEIFINAIMELERTPDFALKFLYKYWEIFFEFDFTLPIYFKALKLPSLLADDNLLDKSGRLGLIKMIIKNTQTPLSHVLQEILRMEHLIKSDELFVGLCMEVLKKATSATLTLFGQIVSFIFNSNSNQSNDTIQMSHCSFLRILKFKTLLPIFKLFPFKMDSKSLLKLIQTQPPKSVQQIQELLSNNEDNIHFESPNSILIHLKSVWEFKAFSRLTGTELIPHLIKMMRAYENRTDLYQDYRLLVLALLKKPTMFDDRVQFLQLSQALLKPLEDIHLFYEVERPKIDAQLMSLLIMMKIQNRIQ